MVPTPAVATTVIFTARGNPVCMQLACIPELQNKVSGRGSSSGTIESSYGTFSQGDSKQEHETTGLRARADRS